MEEDDAAEVRLTRERLRWVEVFRIGILRLLGEDVVHHTVRVSPTADPLKFILHLPLLRPMSKGSRKPFRQYMRQCAQECNCEVPIININNHYVQAEVLTKHRLWAGPNMEEK